MKAQNVVEVPPQVKRWLTRMLAGTAVATPPVNGATIERPRTAYSVRGRIARTKLTPRAIQVLDYLRAHPKANAHQIEKFLVSKAGVPVDSAPNAFRGAMARLRAIDAVRTEPISEAADMAPRKPRKKARKH